MKLADLIPWQRKGSTTIRELDALQYYERLLGTKKSKGGAVVNWDTAIKVSTVLACAGVIARGIAQVPLKIMQEVDGKKRVAREHPLYFLLHNQPNQWQTSFEYRETMALHLVLAGRHYAFRNMLGNELLELIPIEPGHVRTTRETSGEITYHVTMPSGQARDFPEASIWHVRGPSWNGWQGMDPMVLAREAIGLSILAEESQSEMHRNGLRPSGVYSVDGALSPQQYKDLRKFLADNYSGEKQGLPMIVDRGAKWLSTSLNGVDAEHLETRRFQVEEVCRTMGVMPIMVGHADKTATYASAEQMFLAHVVHTLTPWYTRIEQSIDAHLIGREQTAKGYYSNFVAAGLLRGSMKDRADYFAKALGSGGSPAWLTQDEVRSLEEMNPMGGAAAQLPIAANLPRTAPADPVAA